MSLEDTSPEDSPAEIERSIRRHATQSLAKPWGELAASELLSAVALSVRDRLALRMLETEERWRRADPKRVFYLSMEFLVGRLLAGSLENLRLRGAYRQALSRLGASLDELEEAESDAALGNGGLGRLAACFLDSFATLGVPGYGYGINYEYGLFKQEIDNGYQREKPDNWLREGSPWQIQRPAEACLVPLYGRIEHGVDRRGGYNPMWMDWKAIVGVPCDLLVPGYGGRTVTFLRLYAARSSHEFDIRIFNEGDYVKAVEQKIASETVSKILYPSDTVATGRELRLVQEYFLVACAVRDIVRRFEQDHADLSQFAAKVAIQLNDTHPSLAVAELMRILIDEKDMPWDEAWEITRATFAYTNHTLAPEALERWPVPLLEYVLPRHLQIIFEINRRLLEAVGVAFPYDVEKMRRVSLVEESDPKQVRMTHLAIAGSHAVNGVSAVHSDLVKRVLVPDFHQMWPERFHNVTNGVTPRAWLLKANPGLSTLITSTIGDGWVTDLEKLRELEEHASDTSFQDAFLAAKRRNKERLARVVEETVHIRLAPDALFDIQAKRMHGYKRQLLNVMHVVHEYLSLVEDGRGSVVPRAYVFAGKAAPGYWAAKAVIKLIHEVGRIINGDGRARDWLRVVFVPDYRVSLAEKIIPAGDLSEQISTAGTEASGTGNMKFAMNGAVTMGTLDGANIELCEAIGADNMFIFGNDAAAVGRIRASGSYRPRDICAADDRVRRVVDALASDRFCPREPALFNWVREAVLDEGDPFLHLADFGSYLDAQARAAAAFHDRRAWARMAILNVARAGKFSSDRAVRDYARDIWQLGEPEVPRVASVSAALPSETRVANAVEVD